MTTYHFEIKTADTSKSGTDSNIFVTLIGENDQETEEQRLNGYISGNAFERGNIDTCSVPFGIGVGKVKKIKIKSDTKYSGSGWLPSYFKIHQDGQESDIVTIKIDEWIEDEDAHTYPK